MLNNFINSGISVGSGSAVQGNTAGGTITAQGASTITENTVGGGGITAGSVALVSENTVSGGSISVGNTAQVLTNTITGGGINAGNGSNIQRNNIKDPPNGACHQRFGHGASKPVGGQFQRHLNRWGIGSGQPDRQQRRGGHRSPWGCAGHQQHAAWQRRRRDKLVSGTSIDISGNNLEFNTGAYDVEDRIPKTTLMMVPANNNWWGTTNNAAIAQRIWDFGDDYSLGQVLYDLKASGPVQNAQAYVRSVTLDPPSPVGIETADFEVVFSRRR